MDGKFDAKAQAESLSRLLEMASTCMTKPGGAIHTERLVDYTSGEFERLTMEQVFLVLAEMDSHYEKNLLRDGFGAVIGYAYSKRIFVILRRDKSEEANEYAKFAKKMKAKADAKKTAR